MSARADEYLARQPLDPEPPETDAEKARLCAADDAEVAEGLRMEGERRAFDRMGITPPDRSIASCPAFLVMPGESHRPCARERGHAGFHRWDRP